MKEGVIVGDKEGDWVGISLPLTNYDAQIEVWGFIEEILRKFDDHTSIILRYVCWRASNLHDRWVDCEG